MTKLTLETKSAFCWHITQKRFSLEERQKCLFKPFRDTSKENFDDKLVDEIKGNNVLFLKL
jgi:hypothetical protein